MKIALGTVQLGLAHGIANQDGQVSREEAKTIISLARSLGVDTCLLYTSPSPRDQRGARMASSA